MATSNGTKKGNLAMATSNGTKKGNLEIKVGCYSIAISEPSCWLKG